MSFTLPKRGVIRGIVQLARFRPAGFAEFTATPQGFLNSLAPVIALALVGVVLILWRFGLSAALGNLAVLAVALLAPQVISAYVAGLWQRDHEWLRYAVAFNWCQWAVPVVVLIVLLGVGILRVIGLPEQGAFAVARLGIGGYAIALYWFLARHGLGLSRAKATLFVIVVNLGTVILLVVPGLLAAALS